MAKKRRRTQRPSERQPFSRRWRAKTFTGRLGMRARLEEQQARAALLDDPHLPPLWAKVARAAPAIDRLVILFVCSLVLLACLVAVAWSPGFGAVVVVLAGAFAAPSLKNLYEQHLIEQILLGFARGARDDARARAQARAEAERKAEAALRAEIDAPLPGDELESAGVEGSSAPVAIPLRVRSSSE